jgi:L-xylulokinase
MRERLIGIDAGGTMANVVLFGMRGNDLGCERQPNQMLMPQPRRTGRDAEQMRFAAYRNVQSLFEKTNTEPKDISAITPSGYGGDIYFNYPLIRPDAAKPDATEFCAKGSAA